MRAGVGGVAYAGVGVGGGADCGMEAMMLGRSSGNSGVLSLAGVSKEISGL